MNIVIIGAQSPKTIGHTVYGAEDVFILVKRSVFRSASFNLFSEFLRKFSAGSCIVIRIHRPLFLTGEIGFYKPKIEAKSF